MNDLWVFGYGSLMWRPGFAHEETRRATLVGYRRCFCITSVHHRGTLLRPGLVLGLDRGGACTGLAFRVAAGKSRETLGYLRAREQVNGVYREAMVPLALDGELEPVLALTYLAERAHPSYAGELPLRAQARLIRAAEGLSGSNLEYLASTLEHLASLGIRERSLERLAVIAGAAFMRGSSKQRQDRIDGLVGACRSQVITARCLTRTNRKRFGHRVNMGGA